MGGPEQAPSLVDRAARLLVPAGVRNLLKRAAFSVPFPIRMGGTFRRFWRELSESESWPEERLRAAADAKVRRLVAHAYEHVPYYRELFDREGIDPREIRGTADLPRIPVLTKATLKERFEDLKARDFERHRPELCQTGGSTGARTRFCLSRNARASEYAALYRHYKWAGYRFGDRCASLYLPLEGAAKDLIHYDNPRTQKRELNTRFLTRERFRELIDAWVDHRAEVLWIYPSHLELLCRYIEETGDRRLRPRTVIVNAEVLYEHQRERAREVLGCDAFDWYGLGEHVAAAGECEHHGYHIPEELVAVEVLNGAGEAPPGERGEIIGTSLENFAQPLIRYRTGDYAIRRAGRCPCGRAHRMLTEIGGRTQDVITTPEGFQTFRHGLCAFDEIPGLDAVQIEQLELRKFLVRTVAPRGLSDESATKLRKMIEGAIGFEAAIELVPVADVPRTERGKHRLVISRVPFSFLESRGGATATGAAPAPAA